MALGASSGGVSRHMAAETMRPVVIAAGVGLVICLAVTRMLERVLFGVGPLDATTFFGVPAFLFGTALLASYRAARRAARGGFARCVARGVKHQSRMHEIRD